MATTRPGVFDPIRTYVHLPDGPDATLVEVGADFWSTIATRTDLHDGRMVTAYHFRTDADWNHWERHPAGDEIVVLLSGAMDLVLDEDGRRRTVGLRGRSAFVIPRNVWHLGVVREPADALFVTRGHGTEHRPLTTGDRA